jgi:hypothetical protein
MQNRLQPRHASREGNRQKSLSPKPQLMKNGAGNSSNQQQAQKTQKKQPSEILNLFTAIKKEPNLEERRAIQSAKQLANQKRHEHEKKLKQAEEKLRQQIKGIQDDCAKVVAS